jgi:hypothetical protein
MTPDGFPIVGKTGDNLLMQLECVVRDLCWDLVWEN